MLSNTNNTENNWKNHGCLIVQAKKETISKMNEDIEQLRNIQQQHGQKIKTITLGNMGGHTSTLVFACPPRFSIQHLQDRLKGFYRTA